MSVCAWSVLITGAAESSGHSQGKPHCYGSVTSGFLTYNYGFALTVCPLYFWERAGGGERRGEREREGEGGEREGEIFGCVTSTPPVCLSQGRYSCSQLSHVSAVIEQLQLTDDISTERNCPNSHPLKKHTWPTYTHTHTHPHTHTQPHSHSSVVSP